MDFAWILNIWNATKQQQKKEQYLEKRLEKLDVLESSSLAWLASTATKNGFTMESLYGMSHYYYAALAAAAAARYFYLSMLESHQSRPQLMQKYMLYLRFTAIFYIVSTTEDSVWQSKVQENL